MRSNLPTNVRNPRKICQDFTPTDSDKKTYGWQRKRKAWMREAGRGNDERKEWKA